MPLQEVQIMNKSRVVPEGTTKRYREGNFHSSYSVLNELGRGRFAVVRKCKHKESSRHFAAKFVRKRKMGRDCREDILKEIRILETSNMHSRLIGLHEVYETSTEVIIVLEFAIGGELHRYCVTDKDDSFCERDVVRLLRQILEAVHYLHAQNIAHLDLKPQNILLTSTEPSNGDIRLIDFGIARYLKNGEEIRDIQGTPDYVAPEILNYEPITLASDMWSIGVLTYVMLTGISPFAGDTKQETFLNISQVNLEFHEEDFGCYSPEAREFIENLCVKEPEKRLTAHECLQHQWFQKFTNGTQIVEEVQTNKRIEHEENSSADTPLHTVELVISTGDGDVSKDKDDVNDNYLDNKADYGLTNESKVKNEPISEVEKLSSTNGVRSGMMSVHVHENVSDMDVQMDCEGKDSENARVIGHEEVDGSTQSEEHSVGCEAKARDFSVGSARQTTSEGSMVTPSSLQSECNAVCERNCRSCERLHPDAQGHINRSRSPSSSPMGTRRAFCLNKENLPKDIREPKRFCHQVSSQQPGQVVC